MTTSARQVLDDALRLSEAERTVIAEKLVESLASPGDPQIEQAHLRVVEERQKAYHAGRSTLVDGDEALAQVRAALRR